MKKLTNRQKEILDYIKWFITEYGFSPSIRDIGSHFEMSPNGAYDHVIAIEKKGKIIRNNNGAKRSIVVVDTIEFIPDSKSITKSRDYQIVKSKMAAFPKGNKCIICNTIEDIHRHHEDYNKPFEVIELCRKHHKQLHITKRILTKKGYNLTISKC